MRDAFNQFIPLVQNDFNGVVFANGAQTVTSHVSNGYYGYQPVVEKEPPCAEPMDFAPNTDSIQFNNYIEREIQPLHFLECRENAKQTLKKRTLDDQSEQPDLKKRRENDIEIAPKRPKNEEVSLEELLAKTHGCNWYHWEAQEV